MNKRIFSGSFSLFEELSETMDAIGSVAEKLPVAK